jgi:hypothetical protein
MPCSCALLGDNIAEMAHKNGWSGIIINGCIRDSEVGRILWEVRSILCWCAMRAGHATVGCFHSCPDHSFDILADPIVSQDIGKMPLGVKALATYPLKSAKRDKGLRDVPIMFAGVVVKPGDWVYADKVGWLGGGAGHDAGGILEPG